MPKLKIKQPCNDCPFRRKAAPGWLGASYPEEFCEQTLASQHHGVENSMPCHKTLNYEDDNWREQLPEAAICAGSLQFLNNYMVFPYLPDMIAACQAVGVNPDVFANPIEFMTHHTYGEIPEWMLIGPKVLVKVGDQMVPHQDANRKRRP